MIKRIEVRLKREIENKEKIYLFPIYVSKHVTDDPPIIS